MDDTFFSQEIDRERENAVKYKLRQPLFGRDDVLPMWVADMDFQTPPFLRETIQRLASQKSFGYTLKPAEINESICKWQHSQHEWDIHPNWIEFLPGVVPGIAITLEALSERNTTVIIQSPVYPPFFTIGTGINRKIVDNQLLNEQGRYLLDFTDLEDKFKRGAEVLLLCNPHNPVGRVWKRAELLKLAKLCAEYDVLVISDEIHADIVFSDNKHSPFASVSKEAAENSVTLCSVSKSFNVTGLASAYAVIPNTRLRKRFCEYLHSTHLGYGNIFGIECIQTAYSQGHKWILSLNKYLEKNLRFATDYLNQNTPFKTKVPEATFLLWLDCRDFSSDEKELNSFFVDRAGLGLSSGKSFGCEGFMRMNVALPLHKLEQALQQIKTSL